MMIAKQWRTDQWHHNWVHHQLSVASTVKRRIALTEKVEMRRHCAINVGLNHDSNVGLHLAYGTLDPLTISRYHSVLP